jgi:hypothetical protein
MSLSLRFGAGVQLQLFEAGSSLPTRLSASHDYLTIEAPIWADRMVKVFEPTVGLNGIPHQVAIESCTALWRGTVYAAEDELLALTGQFASFVLAKPDAEPNAAGQFPGESHIQWVTTGAKPLIDARRLRLSGHPLEVSRTGGPRVDVLFGAPGFWDFLRQARATKVPTSCSAELHARAAAAGFPRLAELAVQDPRAALAALPPDTLDPCPPEPRAKRTRRRTAVSG